MKDTLILIIFLIIAGFTNAQNENKIVIGKTDTIFSKFLNEKRKILVYTPNLTSPANPPNQRYPVLYLLDGEAHFVSTAGLVQQLSQANGNAVLPEMIVVGITNTNRFRDLTPSANGTGGSNNFMKFIETELMPYVESNYNTAPYKILVGHSLGGLTAIDVLTGNANLFNAYIAIDPSMWFENERFLQNAIAQLPDNKMENKRLFIGTANTMPKGMTLPKLRKDTSNETQHIRSIFKLDNFFKTKPVPGLMYAHNFYENETHVSVPLISEYDGLRFVFNYYLMDVSEKDFKDPTTLIANKYKAHYNKVSKEMGYKVVPPEAFINYLGADALQEGQYKKADALLMMNIENFPNSDMAYDAYGDFLVIEKDTSNAIIYYKKSMAIKSNAVTEQKLNSILPQVLRSAHDSYTVSENELLKYTGNYIIEQYKVTVVVKLKDGVLWAITPGQTDSELVPVSKDIFKLKSKQGYTITFHREGDKVISFTSVQPNGTFQIIKQ
jgi:predicted alpha/beta superfamily hydrolase